MQPQPLNNKTETSTLATTGFFSDVLPGVKKFATSFAPKPNFFAGIAKAPEPVKLVPQTTIKPDLTSNPAKPIFDISEDLIAPPKKGSTETSTAPKISVPAGVDPMPFLKSVNKMLPGIMGTFGAVDKSIEDKSFKPLIEYEKDFFKKTAEENTSPNFLTKGDDGKLYASRDAMNKTLNFAMGFISPEGGEIKAETGAAEEVVSTGIGKVRNILKQGQEAISKDSGAVSKVKKFFKGAMTDFYDSSASINKFMTDAEDKLGRKLTAEENAYVGARLFKGVGGKIEYELNKFGDILQNAGEDVKNGNLSSYLFAQRSEERAARGFSNPGGLTGEESKKAIEDLKAELGPERFAKLEEGSKQIYAYADDLLIKLKDGGIISEDAYKSIKAENQRYTPFDIVEHMLNKEESGNLRTGTNSFNVASQDVIKGIKGAKETDLIDDPLNAFVRKTIKITDLTERNSVVQKLANVAKESGLGFQLRSTENVLKRRELYVQLGELGDRLKQTFSEFRRDYKLSKSIQTDLNSLEREISDIRKKTAEGLTRFFNEGFSETKSIGGESRLRTIPLELQSFEKEVMSFKNEEDFLKSMSLEKEYEEGLLERNGFKDRKDFYKAVTKPYSKSEVKIVEKKITSDIDKVISLQHKLSKIGEKKEFTQIAKQSVDDAVSHVQSIIDGLKEQKTILRENIEGVIDIKDVPREFERLSYSDKGIKNEIAVPKEVAETMKSLTTRQADLVTRGMSFWSKALRAGATSLNLAFIVPNALRDFETATLVSKNGFNIVDWGKGFWEATKATLADYGVKADDSIYQNYLRDAGQIGGYYSTYLREVPKTVEDLTKPMYRKLLSLLNPFHLIEEAGSIIERTPRLGTYMKALSKGDTATEAAFASRESTVDFAKMGEVTRIFNMWVPFVNARLQGEVNIAKSLLRDIKDPKRAFWAAAKIGGMAIAPFVASYYNNISRFPDVWNDIASYEKSNNIILIYGNQKDDQGRYTQILKFPKGDWNYFIDPIQDFLEWSHGNQPDLLQTLATDSMMDFLPLSTSPQETFGKTVEQGVTGLLPSPVKAMIEDITNMNLFRMTPIVPKSMEKAAAEEQYHGYTPRAAVALGRLTGLSPLKIQNTIETLFAGLGRQALMLGGTEEKPGVTLPTKATAERFTSAAGGAQSKKIDTDIVSAQTDMATRQVIEQRAAENAFKSIVNASSDEEAQKIVDSVSDNPRIVKKITDMIMNAAQGTDASDKAVKALSPIERAQYIYTKIKGAKTDDEAAAFAQEMQDKGLFTDETATEFQKLLEQD